MKFLRSLKSKVLTFCGLAMFGSNAFADGLAMSVNGEVTGSFDMKPVFYVIGALFTAWGSVVVLKWAFNMLRRG